MTIFFAWRYRVSSPNKSLKFGHYRGNSQAKKERQRAAVETANLILHYPVRFPVEVTLIRVGKRLLDDDNLAGAFKHIRDGVAQSLGIDDGDKSKVTWKYQDERGPDYWVKVRIEERHTPVCDVPHPVRVKDRREMNKRFGFKDDTC